MSIDEERLISKKEVLEKTGISYGQLYRWKRKGLIPESWFFRRSTFTGQETFFPRDKIIERIEQIKKMKGSRPLDDLAEVITEKVNEKLRIAFDRLRQLDWFDESILEAFDIDKKDGRPLSIKEALSLGALSRLRRTAREEERDLLKRTLEVALQEKDLLDRIPEEALRLYLLRKRLSGGGISAEISLAAIAGPGAIFDPDTEAVDAIDLGDILERIKLEVGREPEAQSDTEDEDER